MTEHIDYYLSLNSPWSYMGHARLVNLAARHGLQIRIHPVDFAGVIFPVTGGLPVGKRSPQRQAYRLVELDRWRKHLDIALNINPRFWPANEALATQSVLAARESGADAVAFAGALLRSVWADERDIAERGTVLAVAGECGLDGESLVAAGGDGEMAALRERESRAAIEQGVFGAPTYIFRRLPYWGQDRLAFLEQAASSIHP